VVGHLEVVAVEPLEVVVPAEHADQGLSDQLASGEEAVLPVMMAALEVLVQSIALEPTAQMLVAKQ